jgi:hypothetical protein
MCVNREKISEKALKLRKDTAAGGNIKNWLSFSLRLVKIILSLYTSGVCQQQTPAGQFMMF